MGGQKQIWLLGPQSLRTCRRSEDSQSTGVKKGFRVTEEVQELDQLSSMDLISVITLFIDSFLFLNYFLYSVNFRSNMIFHVSVIVSQDVQLF